MEYITIACWYCESPAVPDAKSPLLGSPKITVPAADSSYVVWDETADTADPVDEVS